MKRICLFVFLCGIVSAADIPMKNCDAPGEIRKNKRYKREENGEDWLLDRVEVSWPKGSSSEIEADSTQDATKNAQPSSPTLYKSQEDQAIQTDRPKSGGEEPKQPYGGNGDKIQPNRLIHLIIQPKETPHIGRINEGYNSEEVFINDGSDTDPDLSSIDFESGGDDSEGKEKEDNVPIGTAAKNEQVNWENDAGDIAWTFGIPKDSIKTSDILLAREGTGDDYINDWKKVSWSKVILWILMSVGCVVSISCSTEVSRYGTNKTESKTAQIIPRSSKISSDDELPTTDEDPSAVDYVDTEPHADSGNYNETAKDENGRNSTNTTEDNVESNWRRLTNKYGFNPYATNTRRIINNYGLSKIMAESRPYYYRRMLGRLDNVYSRNNFGKGSKKKSKQPESAVSNIREVREKLFDHLLNYVRGISVEDLIQNGTGSLDDKLTNYYDVAIGVNDKNRDQKEVSSNDKYSEISAENEHGESENFEENANDYEFEGYDHANIVNSDTLSNEYDGEVSNKKKFDSTLKKSNDTAGDLHNFKVRNSIAIKNVNESHNSDEIDNYAHRSPENYENNTTAWKPGVNKTMELKYSGMNENISNDDINREENKQTQNKKYINVTSGKSEETSYQAKEVNGGNEITKIDQIGPSRTENITKFSKKYHGSQINESSEENNKQKHQNRHKKVTNTTAQFSNHHDENQKDNLKNSENDTHQTSYIKRPDHKGRNKEYQENQIDSIQINSKQNKDKHVKQPKETETNKINKSKTLNGTESNKIINEKQHTTDNRNSTTDTDDDANGRRSQAVHHNYGVKTYRQNTKDESGRIHLHLDFEIS